MSERKFKCGELGCDLLQNHKSGKCADHRVLTCKCGLEYKFIKKYLCGKCVAKKSLKNYRQNKKDLLC